MTRTAAAVVSAHEVGTALGSAIPGPGPCSDDHVSVVYIEGRLRVPIDRQLRHRVRALLNRGERCLVLDLARVSRIDAAGVGELVRAYNMTAAANGLLRVAHATKWVSLILERVGLYEILSSGRRSLN
jgi:anti-anti-sigma factor